MSAPQSLSEETPDIDAEFYERMKSLCTGDTERDHIKADEMIVELLIRLGCPQTAELYRAESDSWYYA